MLGVGGPQPGQWVFPVCAGPGAIDPMPAVWVTGAKPVAVTVQLAPVVVAEQAAKTLGLTSAVIEMAPPDGHQQLVNVATWLWVNPHRLATGHRHRSRRPGDDDGCGCADQGGLDHGRRPQRHL